VASQNYDDFEYIIVDGGSTDGTLDIVEKYSNKITKVVSEPDNGIYDAMNKGIRLASGDVIGILNSDDFYSHNQVLDSVADSFQDRDTEVVYSNLTYVDRQDVTKKVRYWKAGSYEEKKLDYGWIPPHPTCFIRKEVYQKYGQFNLDFHIAADYELLLRFLKKGLKIKYLDMDLVCMRTGGASGRNLSQRWNGWQELRKAWDTNNLVRPKFFVTKRILHKIKQYL